MKKNKKIYYVTDSEYIEYDIFGNVIKEEIVKQKYEVL